MPPPWGPPRTQENSWRLSSVGTTSVDSNRCPPHSPIGRTLGKAMQIYSWLVLIHVIAVLGFVFAHGGAAFTSFRVRRERNIETVATLIQLGEVTNRFMYP